MVGFTAFAIASLYNIFPVAESIPYVVSRAIPLL